MRGVLVVFAVCVLLVSGVGVGLCEEGRTSTDGAGSDSSVLAKPSLPGKPYTSVIVDASGLSLQRCMSPHIRRGDGSEIWGTLKNLTAKDYEFIEDRGLVGFVSTMDEALKNWRSGANPMVVKALAVAGGKAASDPVLTDEDASLVLAENAKGKFLEGYNIIFVNGAKPVQTAKAE